MSDELLLTIEDAAQRLAMGRSRVYELMKSGELESVHIGRSRRIPVEALRSFVDKLRTSQVKVGGLRRLARRALE
jgi:excisionase family DNA binding protein